VVTGVASLSVAISTRDRPDALERCLRSLAGGDARPAEVVVVDQSADEATREVVDRCRQSVGVLTYVRSAPVGLAVSQNLAVAHATHPIVAVIDDDCVADRRWLAALDASFAASDAIAAVTGPVLPMESEGERQYAVASRVSPDQRDFSGIHAPWYVGSGNNFAVRREWFQRIRGCDERLGPGSPGQGAVDMDLFYRLLRAGARIRYVPEALVRHERQTKAGRMSRRSMYGHGMGAMCVFLAREGDRYAPRMLARWALFRSRLLAASLLRGHWLGVQEEWLMLGGTLRGLIHGLLTPRQAPQHR
jgi:GT2 family glycosyltransferase